MANQQIRELVTHIEQLRTQLHQDRHPSERSLSETPGVPDPVSEPLRLRSAPAPDPDRLDKGENPSFNIWLVQIRGKLRVNADHYPTEDARMHYVFNRTKGDAQGHLYPRFNDDATEPFETAEEMIRSLREVMTNPYRIREARVEYRRLKMKPGQPFYEFKTKYYRLADEAQIPASERFDDLYDKLTTTLQRQLVGNLCIFEGDIHMLCKFAGRIDSELMRISAKEAQEHGTARAVVPRAATATATTAATPTTTPAFAAGTSPAVPRHFTGPSRSTVTPRPEVRRSTPVATAPTAPTASVTCYTCGQTGHISPECPRRQVDLKEIEEEMNSKEELGTESGNDDA
jgi:hypothetical protein